MERVKIRPKTTNKMVPNAVFTRSPGMKSSIMHVLGRMVLAQTDPNNRITDCDTSSITAPVMKENLLGKSLVEAHSDAAPAINAPIGNARRNPPVIP